MKTQKNQENRAVLPSSFPGGTGNQFCKNHSCQPRMPTVKLTLLRVHCDETHYEHSLRCTFLFQGVASELSAKPSCRKQECLSVNPNESSSLRSSQTRFSYTSLSPRLFLFAFSLLQTNFGIPIFLITVILLLFLHGPNQND